MCKVVPRLNKMLIYRHGCRLEDAEQDTQKANHENIFATMVLVLSRRPTGPDLRPFDFAKSFSMPSPVFRYLTQVLPSSH